MARINKPGGVTLQREMTYTERREQVARLYLEGKTQAEIARTFAVNQSTISRDLEAIRQEWIASSVKSFDEIKSRELARIDRLEREYWEAWEASKQDADEVREKGAPIAGKVQTVEIVRTVKGQTGNPQFLAGVQWCIEQRLKIYGIYEAVKLKVTYDWQDEVVEKLRRGEFTAEEVDATWPDLAGEFFAKAGIDASSAD